MSLINSALFTKLSDRLAYQYEQLKSGVELGSGIGTNGPHYTIVTSSNDYNVESTLMNAAYNIDVDYNTETVVAGISQFSALFSALEKHIKDFGYKDMSLYLSGVGIKVSRSFGEFYNIVTGRTIDDEYLEDRVVSL